MATACPLFDKGLAVASMMVLLLSIHFSVKRPDTPTGPLACNRPVDIPTSAPNPKLHNHYYDKTEIEG